MRVRIVYNRFLPLGRSIAMSVWPLVFAKQALGVCDKTHELIHCRQQLEVHALSAIAFMTAVSLGASPWLLVLIPLPYYVLYLMEYLVRLALYRSHLEAYGNISFEQEAYINQRDQAYVYGRPLFGWVRYITKKSFIKKR